MKNLHRTFSNLTILIICGLLYTSCSPIFYGPTTQALPGLEEQGDVKLSVAGSYVYEVSGVDLGVAYSPIDRIGVLLSYSRFSESKPSVSEFADLQTFGGQYNLIDIGLGTYKQLAPGFIWENYALVSRGKIDVADNRGRQLNANLLKLGVQSGILFKHKVVEIGASTKLSYLNYSTIDGDLLRVNGFDEVTNLRQHNKHLLLEPGLVFSAGYDPIKFNLQLVGSAKLTKAPLVRTTLYVSFGVSFAINKDQIK